MGWRTDKPLYTLTDDSQNDTAKGVWEGESLGGIAEDNNRLPSPVVWLLGMTVITAFMITFPLWGQRPTADIYVEYVQMMDSPAVQAIEDDRAKMDYMVANAKDATVKALQERHPLEMDDLRLVKDQIIELQRQGVDLQEYTIIGPIVKKANFEGAKKANGEPTRKQPWWDKGYLIDVFYVIYFCIAVLIVIKRLPHYSWQPDHSVAH
jgi:hypothetical protein